MPIVDLTHPIADGMSLFPGTPLPRITPLASPESDGYAEKQIQLTGHTGTHMDAPAHVFSDATTLDQWPCDRFTGSAVLVDCRDYDGPVSADCLGRIASLKSLDFIIFRTGWERYWGTPHYARQGPYLSEELALALAALPLKGIGIDALSPDPIDSSTLPVHATLLKHGILLIENLRGLDRLPSDRKFELTALPLLYADSDGAPARVIARF